MNFRSSTKAVEDRPPFGPNERRQFLIQRLGDLGNSKTVRLLEQWAEDATLGKDTVAAIRKLNAKTS